jgi:3-isopropylmalate/(R)-2-methylmalate dehydratase large subunit
MRDNWPPTKVALSPGKRVLFLTKDLELIKQQLYEGLNLKMEDLEIEDLLDDINTDVMTPAWVCFDHDPAEIAKNAYAGLMHNGLRVFRENALKDGDFEVIVSGQRKGTGFKPRNSRAVRAMGWNQYCHRCLVCANSRA